MVIHTSRTADDAAAAVLYSILGMWQCDVVVLSNNHWKGKPVLFGLERGSQTKTEREREKGERRLGHPCIRQTFGVCMRRRKKKIKKNCRLKR